MSLLQVQAQRKLQKDVDFPPQPNQPQPQPKKEAYDLGRLTLAKEKGEDLKETLDAAEDRIKEKEWKRATDILQKLVERKEDVFVPRLRKDKEGEALLYVSVKKEAARMIGDLPLEGKKFYDAEYGPRAVQEVKQARTNNNFQQMAAVMSRFLHTEAGADACGWCATYQLDRANFAGAANFYQTLILRNTTKDRSGVEDLKVGQLVRAAYAFHQAGDPGSQKHKGDVLKELERRNVKLKLGGQAEDKSVADLKEELDKFVASVSTQTTNDVRSSAAATAATP